MALDWIVGIMRLHVIMTHSVSESRSMGDFGIVSAVKPCG